MEISSKVICGTELSLSRGDITLEKVDAIVNAAKSSLTGGGGVDGAIHRAGGPTIMQECMEIRKMQGGCAPGSAVITGGGKLSAQYVIHTVGPIWRGGGPSGNEAKTLASAYKSCLTLAVEYALKTISFPSISTGAYGYPVEEAALVALNAVSEFLHEHSIKDNSEALTSVRFVLYDPTTFEAYAKALQQLA